MLVRKLFERPAQHNVAINVSKLVFAQPSEKLGGYIVNSTGFSPHPDLMKAIRDFPVPRNATDVRSFHGLCQQVGHFSTKVAESLKPLSPLLKKVTFGNGRKHTTTLFKTQEKLYPKSLICFFTT
jgi:hypothetical protein